MPFAKTAVEREIHVVDQDGRVYRDAVAILKIASQYPRLQALTAIGQFPLVKPLLPIGYIIVAANRRFLFGPASRIFWLKTVIIPAFCIGLVMSSRLWIGPRTYPLAPISRFLPASIYPIDIALFAALFALAAAILISPRPQIFIFAFMAVIAAFLPPRSNPLAAMGLPIRSPACRTCLVLMGQQRRRRPAAHAQCCAIDRRRDLRLLRAAEAERQFHQQ